MTYIKNIIRFKYIIALILCAGLPLQAFAYDLIAAPEGAKVYIISPENNATVQEKFKVRFGLTGMGIAPAGIEKENTGHHHLLVNTKLEGEALKEPIPADDNHLHFGGGQTEVEVTLPKGKHTLQLVLGDHNHYPHKTPIMSEVITVTVE